MLFRVFGGSLGLEVGAPGGFLAALLVPLGAPGGTPNSHNFLFGHPGAPILAPEEPTTTPNNSRGALMARQMAPRSHQGPSGDVFRPTPLRYRRRNLRKKEARYIVQALRSDYRLSSYLLILLSRFLLFCFFLFCSSLLSLSLIHI